LAQVGEHLGNRHPELAASASGFYANSGSCTAVVEGVGGNFGLPPAFVRNQQAAGWK